MLRIILLILSHFIHEREGGTRRGGAFVLCVSSNRIKLESNRLGHIRGCCHTLKITCEDVHTNGPVHAHLFKKSTKTKSITRDCSAAQAFHTHTDSIPPTHAHTASGRCTLRKAAFWSGAAASEPLM